MLISCTDSSPFPGVAPVLLKHVKEQPCPNSSPVPITSLVPQSNSTHRRHCSSSPRHLGQVCAPGYREGPAGWGCSGREGGKEGGTCGVGMLWDTGREGGTCRDVTPALRVTRGSRSTTRGFVGGWHRVTQLTPSSDSPGSASPHSPFPSSSSLTRSCSLLSEGYLNAGIII